MAISVANASKAAALTGICAELNLGEFRLLNAADSELAKLIFAATAFPSVTSASPSVATSGSNNPAADSSITTNDTIAYFELRTSAGSLRIRGTVGVGTGDLQVTSATIPASATSVSCSGGLSLSLNIS